MKLRYLTICLMLQSFTLLTEAQSRRNEIDLLCDSIFRIHQFDDFYLHFRPTPSVRISIEDYSIQKIGDKWTSSYSINYPMRKVKIHGAFPDSILSSIVKEINIDDFFEFPFRDSIALENAYAEHGGVGKHFLICSKGKIRRIDYPGIGSDTFTKDMKKRIYYWNSEYLNHLFILFDSVVKGKYN